MSLYSQVRKRVETGKGFFRKRGRAGRWKLLTSVNKMTATNQTGSIVIL